MKRCAALAGLALVLCTCTHNAALPEAAGYGPDPVLPLPDPERIPTLDIAPARGWPERSAPVPATGLNVTRYATDLDHPRWLYVLPNGDVLVAETNGPDRPDDATGIRGHVMRWAQKRAGSGTASAGRITLLRDSDADGSADVRTTFIDGLNSPFGMTLVDDRLYVAATDELLRFPYRTGDTRISAPGLRITALPAGPINHHWTKNVLASPDGSRLYVSVGSNSNAGENGLEQETNRAAILEVDPANGRSRVFASGLRNPVGLAWNPATGDLWTTVNERDEIGGDLVPDYLTSVRDGGFYGWPFSYFGGHVDPRVEPQRPDLVARALVPDFALGAHTASLGLAFSRGDLLKTRYADGAFVAQHGSWNRRPQSGYRVIFVRFSGGAPQGTPEEVLGGFVTDTGNALGRPVGVAIDGPGALLVADDAGNTIWRVTPD